MKFRTWMIDPPWPERGGGKIKRGADRHYKVIGSEVSGASESAVAASKEAILEATRVLMPEDEVETDAHLYLWVTNNYLPWGLWLMEHLGFTFKTTIVWVKVRKSLTAADIVDIVRLITSGRFVEAFRRVLRAGIGQYFRGGHELILFGVRGRGYATKTVVKDLTTTIVAPRYSPQGDAGPVQHSAKPDEAFALVEDRSVGPYCEVFSRRARAGWVSRGDEAPATEEEAEETE